MQIVTLCVLAWRLLFALPSASDRLHAIRPILDAHNDKATGKGHPVGSISNRPTGAKSTLRDRFFEQVRPIMEKSFFHIDTAHWPPIKVHFDLKDYRAEMLPGRLDTPGRMRSMAHHHRQGAAVHPSLPIPAAWPRYI